MRGVARVALGGLVGLALLAGPGCSRPPPPHRSDALARSRALLDKVDRLEAELHNQNSELVLYGELGARRQAVSEVACQVAKTHVKEIERLADAQKRKRLEKARARKLALLNREAPRHGKN